MPVSRTASWLLRAGTAIMAAMSPLTAAFAEMRVNFQEPVTGIAQDQYDLHMLVFAVIMVIGVLVFGVMIYSIIVHRKSTGRKPAQFHENLTVELIWTVIPFIIIVALAVPATRVVLELKDSSSPDLTVKVVGYQWKWSYDYLDDNVFFYSTMSTPVEQIGPLMYLGDGSSAPAAQRGENYLLEVDNHMVVPVGAKVRVLLTAADVIHSWYVPQLGVKQDAIPGIVRDTWFQAEREGVYRGQCTELCGKNHAYMPIVVEVVSPAKYASWVADQGGGAAGVQQPVAVGDVEASAPVAVASAGPDEWTEESVFEFGSGLYTTQCVACHQANGEGLPPTFPALNKSAIVDEDASEHIKVMLDGREGTTMASFAHLSNEDIAALVQYERNAWDNSAGGLVMPEDVEALR